MTWDLLRRLTICFTSLVNAYIIYAWFMHDFACVFFFWNHDADFQSNPSNLATRKSDSWNLSKRSIQSYFFFSNRWGGVMAQLSCTRILGTAFYSFPWDPMAMTHDPTARRCGGMVDLSFSRCECLGHQNFLLFEYPSSKVAAGRRICDRSREGIFLYPFHCSNSKNAGLKIFGILFLNIEFQHRNH